MPSEGRHVILKETERDRLLAASGDGAVLKILDDLSGLTDASRSSDCGRYWDAIHRTLSNGTLYYDEGEYPLNRVVLGGRQLLKKGEGAAALLDPVEVKDAAAALTALTEEAFHERYDRIDPDDYEGEFGDDDRRHAWGMLKDIRRLFSRAAAEEAALVFIAEVVADDDEDKVGEEE